MQEANRRGGEEGLMCNYRGELSECSQANFFMVRGGRVLTPPSEAGLLEGITRAFLFEVGRDAGIDVREEVLYPKDLETADEAFITSTTRELSPVTKIDGKPVGSGQVGAITRRMLAGLPQARAGTDVSLRRCAPIASILDSEFLILNSSVSAYSSIGGHAQIRLRSPYGLSIRDTAGQNLLARTNGSGYAACSRV